jgi:hypothetical protein
LVTDGLVSPQGSLVPVPYPDPVQIMQLFRHKLIKALLAREKITPRLVEIMRNWRHPGFSVYQGERIDPDGHQARQRLAGYMVHPPIAMERLRYRPETSRVISIMAAKTGGAALTSPPRPASSRHSTSWPLCARIFRIPDSSWSVTTAPFPMCAGFGLRLALAHRLRRLTPNCRTMTTPVAPRSSRAGAGVRGGG